MSKTTEALKLAEEALYAELESDTYEEFAEAAEKCHKALAAIREALAEHPMDYDQGFVDGVEAQLAEPEVTDTKITDCKSEQMPVGYIYNDITSECIPVYAAPVSAKRECVDLTCQEITALIMEGAAGGGWQGFAERVQAAFKEKNK